MKFIAIRLYNRYNTNMYGNESAHVSTPQAVSRLMDRSSIIMFLAGALVGYLLAHRAESFNGRLYAFNNSRFVQGNILIGYGNTININE